MSFNYPSLAKLLATTSSLQMMILSNVTSRAIVHSSNPMAPMVSRLSKGCSSSKYAGLWILLGFQIPYRHRYIGETQEEIMKILVQAEYATYLKLQILLLQLYTHMLLCYASYTEWTILKKGHLYNKRKRSVLLQRVKCHLYSGTYFCNKRVKIQEYPLCVHTQLCIPQTSKQFTQIHFQWWFEPD